MSSLRGWLAAVVLISGRLAGCADSCGDGLCGTHEGPDDCPADCTCGNGVCDEDEGHGDCAVDCPQLGVDLPLYFDFSSTGATSHRFWEGWAEWRHELRGGMLVIEAVDVFDDQFRTEVVVAEGAGDGLVAVVEVQEVALGLGQARVQVRGGLYAAEDGDVWAMVSMSSRGVVDYWVALCSDTDCESVLGATLGWIEPGQPQELGVVWTGGAGIELIAGDLSQSLDLSDELPQTESRDDLPEFSINVEAENQTLGGSVTVAFEEVLVSEAGSLTVYDDFEGDHLDPELWAEGDEQWVVADSALGLVHTGRSTGASLRCPWLFDEMAVDVTVLEDEGAAAGVGAAGMLFSDGDGLVVAAALADGDEAYYQVLRFTGDEIPEELARESLAPIELGSTHMLYYGWDGEQFAFQLDDDEVVTVDPDGIGLGSARDDVGQRAAWVGVLEVGGAGSARLQAVVDNVRALPDGACDYEPPEYCVLDEDSLLADGEFSRGLSCWHQWPDDYVTTSADHPAETTDPSVKIDNWSGSLDEFTQVLQTGFTLEAGHSYRLSFWARGFTDDSWVRVWVQQWTPPAGFFWEDVPLTTEWQLVERTFTSPEDAVDGVMEFQVFMDGAPPVWIDGVVLQEL